MRRIFSLGIVCCLALVGHPAGAATLVDRIAAVVGSEVILLSEVDELITLGIGEGFFQNAAPAERETLRNSYRAEALDQLIGEKLIEQAMREDGISVSDEELDSQLSQIALDNSLTMDQLKEAIAFEGLEWETFRDDMRTQMERQQFVRFEIASRVIIDERKVLAEYNRLIDAKPQTGKVDLQRIRVPAQWPAEALPGVERPQSPADAVVARLEAGEDFDAIARAVSDLPNAAADGSAAGIIDPEQLAEPFRSAVLALGVGEGSGPIPRDDSVWFFRVLRFVTDELPPLEEMRAQIVDTLWTKEVERQLERWIERRRAKAHVEVLL